MTRRATWQRSALSELLAELADFHGAKELHAMLRARGEQVGLSTVYRILQTMAEDAEVDTLQQVGEVLYRRCSPAHHHHVVCRRCGRTIEVEGAEVERWAATVAAQHGFVDVIHQLEVFGTCPGCAVPSP